MTAYTKIARSLMKISMVDMLPKTKFMTMKKNAPTLFREHNKPEKLNSVQVIGLIIRWQQM